MCALFLSGEKLVDVKYTGEELRRLQKLAMLREVTIRNYIATWYENVKEELTWLNERENAFLELF